jgi:hypothetical protein
LTTLATDGPSATSDRVTFAMAESGWCITRTQSTPSTFTAAANKRNPSPVHRRADDLGVPGAKPEHRQG